MFNQIDLFFFSVSFLIHLFVHKRRWSKSNPRFDRIPNAFVKSKLDIHVRFSFQIILKTSRLNQKKSSSEKNFDFFSSSLLEQDSSHSFFSSKSDQYFCVDDKLRSISIREHRIQKELFSNYQKVSATKRSPMLREASSFLSNYLSENCTTSQ